QPSRARAVADLRRPLPAPGVAARPAPALRERLGRQGDRERPAAERRGLRARAVERGKPQGLGDARRHGVPRAASRLDGDDARDDGRADRHGDDRAVLRFERHHDNRKRGRRPMSAISTPVTPSNRRRRAPLIALGAVVVFAAAWFLVLHKHGSSSGSASSTPSTPAATTPGAAPATGTPATGTPAPSAHAATKPAHHAAAPPAHLSDPFGRGVKTSSTSSTGSPASSASSTGSPASTPSPSPAAAQPSTPATSSPTPATSTGGAPSASSPTTAAPVSNTGTVTAEPTTSTPTAAPVHPWRVYHADVRVTPAKSAVHRRLRRLTPLADAQVPFALYLGAVRGGKRVAFLLNRSATVSGPGRCAPFHGRYRTLYLKANQAV